MRKILKVFLVMIVLTISTSMFASTNNEVICATGDITKTSAGILGIDENEGSLVLFYVDNKLVSAKEVNEYGWAKCELTDLMPNSKYSCFIAVVRKDGSILCNDRIEYFTTK